MRIDALDSRGRGISRVGGKVVFVEGALPGEEVVFRYRRVRSGYDEGVVVRVLSPSPDRAHPRCPHFGTCGGCSMQHIAHGAQLQAKQEQLEASFQHFGGVRPDTLSPPLTGAVWGYRRKARLGAKHVPKKGGVLVGFREKSSHLVADLHGCEVLDPIVGRRIGALRQVIGALDARARVPQVEVGVGESGAGLVFRHLGALGASDRERLRDFGREFGFVIFLQPGGPDTVERLCVAPDEQPLLRYRLPAFDLELGFLPHEFTQVNADVNRALVSRVASLLEPRGQERVLDLYCGIGNFSLALARRGGEIVGLEGDPALVARARDNAGHNHVTNAEFHQVDLAVAAERSVWMQSTWDKLVLDPPRSGAFEVLQDLSPPYPARIVYVSCNPATLARDAGVLVRRHGFRLLEAGIVDMFPHTSHVEVIALFVRA